MDVAELMFAFHQGAPRLQKYSCKKFVIYNWCYYLYKGAAWKIVHDGLLQEIQHLT